MPLNLQVSVKILFAQLTTQVFPFCSNISGPKCYYNFKELYLPYNQIEREKALFSNFRLNFGNHKENLFQMFQPQTPLSFKTLMLVKYFLKESSEIVRSVQNFAGTINDTGIVIFSNLNYKVIESYRYHVLLFELIQSNFWAQKNISINSACNGCSPIKDKENSAQFVSAVSNLSGYCALCS